MAKQRSTTRRALVASGISLLLCALMLIGTTLAWFTDQASNKGNRIEAGTLELLVIGYDEDGLNPVNFKTDNTPLINEVNWEPGKENTKYIMVKNNGSLDLKFDLFFMGEDSKLAEALWYSFVEITGPAPGGTYPADIDKLAMTGFGDVNMPDNQLLAGEEKWYRLDYGMNPCAGNEYQGESFVGDIHVVATQTNTAAKIWDNIIPVFTEQDFLDAIADINAGDVSCPTIILMNDIIVDDDLEFTKSFNLDLNGYGLSATGDFDVAIDQDRGTMGLIDTKGGGKIVLNGEFSFVNDADNPDPSNFVFNNLVPIEEGATSFPMKGGTTVRFDFGGDPMTFTNPDGTPLWLDTWTNGVGINSGDDFLTVAGPTPAGSGPYVRASRLLDVDGTGVYDMPPQGYTVETTLYLADTYVDMNQLSYYLNITPYTASNGAAVGGGGCASSFFRLSGNGGATSVIAVGGVGATSVSLPNNEWYTICTKFTNKGGFVWADIYVKDDTGVVVWSYGNYVNDEYSGIPEVYAQISSPGVVWFTSVGAAGIQVKDITVFPN